jgi:hypothetical protein
MPQLEALEDRTLLSVTLLDSFPTGVNAVSSNNASTPFTAALPSIAVGPQYLVEAVLNNIAIFNKVTGQQIVNTPLTTFFASVAPGSSTTNLCSVLFDEQPPGVGALPAGRFYVAAENNTGLQSQLDLAVSISSDPTQGFAFYTLNNGQGFSGISPPPGSPVLGVNHDAIVVSQGEVDQNNNFFNVLEFINKSMLLNQNQLSSTSLGVSGNPLVPADMHGSVAGDPAWFVGENSGPGTSPTLSVVQVGNLLTSPSVTARTSVSVPAYTTTGAVQDPGGTVENAGDLGTVVRNVSYRVVNGTPLLVAGQDVGQSGVTHARWFEFNLTGNNPVLSLSGEINPGAGISTYSPAVGLDPAGDIGMTYMQSSATQFISVYATGRLAADPPGTMESPVLMQAGLQHAAWSSADNGQSFPAISGAGAAVDPNDGTYWTVTEYPNTDPGQNWGTSLEHFFVGTITASTFLTDGNNRLFLFQTGQPLVNTGAFALTFSAGLDTLGKPEVYFTDGNNQLWRWDNGALTETIGFATRLSAGEGLVAFTDGNNRLWTYSDQAGFHETPGFATVFNTAFDAAGNNQIAFLDGNNEIWTYSPSTSAFTETPDFALSISQGRDANGNLEIYFVDGQNHLYRLDQGTATNTGGFAVPTTLYGSQSQVFFLDGGANFMVYSDQGTFTNATQSLLPDVPPGFTTIGSGSPQQTPAPLPAGGGGNRPDRLSSSPATNVGFYRDGNNQLWFFEYGAFLNTGAFALRISAL